jgi:hypothetical protein
VNDLKEAILAAAPTVTSLKITCEGFIVYPKDSLPTDLDYLPVFSAVKALYTLSIPSSETLVTYHNIGQQLATVGVNAPLRELALEEADKGPEALSKIGPRCNSTLRVLRLKAMDTRLPHGVRHRFGVLTHLHLQVVFLSSHARTVCEWLSHEAPLSVQDLHLELILNSFVPDGILDWDATCLTHLVDLHHVKITCSHVCQGVSSVLTSLHHTSQTLQTVTVVLRGTNEDLRYCTAWDEGEIQAVEDEHHTLERVAESLCALRPTVHLTFDGLRQYQRHT